MEMRLSWPLTVKRSSTPSIDGSSHIISRSLVQPFAQLLQIKALWLHGLAIGINDSLKKHRPFPKWHRREVLLADAADGPIDRAGRPLDNETFRHAIPYHGPAGRPAVAGT